MKDKSLNPVLLVGFGLLIVAVVWFMLIRPQSSRLSEARDERLQVEDQLDLARQKAAATPTTVASSEPTPAQLAVPDEPGLSDMLRQLEGIARETGMVHSSVTPSALATVPGVPGGSVQLSITATGSEAGAYTYLNRLALLPRLVIVEQIGFDRATDDKAAGERVNLQLQARVFTTQAAATATS